MRLKPKVSFLTFLFIVTTLLALAGDPVSHKRTDSPSVSKPYATQLNLKKKTNALFAATCYDINWATWSTLNNVNSTTGNIIDADGTPINITMNANYTFSSTPSIYNHAKLSGYPSPIPNSTVPQTTWSAGVGGVTTMCFSRKVTNPVLLLASLGSSAPISSRLDFSLPYVVLYDGGGMVYNSSTSLTGTEGYAVIMFPGEFTCVTINSNTTEFYTNITWGIRPQPFTINITDGPNACGTATVTASGGVSYKWNGGDTPNSATNTFHQSGDYLVTVTDANGCVTSASKKIVVSTFNPTVVTTAETCGSVTLTASGGTTYLWNGGSNPNSATNTFTSNGTYTLKVSNAIGCSQTLSQTVTVPDLSNNIITADRTQICSGQGTSVSFTGTQPNGFVPAGNYIWQSSTDGATFTDIAGATQQNYQLTIFQLLYIRRVSRLGGCTAYSNVIKISTLPPASIAAAGANQNLCNQQQTTLTANAPAADETGTWSVVAPADYQPFDAVSIHNPSAIISNLPIDVNIQLKWTIFKTTCGQQTESTVNIFNNSKLKITAFSLVEQAEPAVIDENNGVITIWVNPNTNIMQLSPTITTNGGTLNPALGVQRDFSGPVVYSVTNACAVTNYTVMVKVVQPEPMSACVNISNLLLPGKIDGATYEWQRLNNNSWQAVGSNKDFLAVPPTPQVGVVQKVYYRSQVKVGSNVSYNPYYEVNFYPQITGSSIVADKQFVCAGDNGIITLNGNIQQNTAVGTTVSYQWQSSANNNNWQNINGATQQNYTYTSTSTQTIYFRRMATAGGCEELSNTIQINYATPITTANAGPAQSVCLNEPVQLNANTVASDEIGTWTVVSPVGYQPFIPSTVNNPNTTIINLPINTDVILRWTIKKQQCAGTSQSTVTIRASSLPVVNAGKNTIINLGEGTALQGSITGTYNNFEWTPATGLSNVNSLTPTASPLFTTNYTLKAITAGGCIVSATVRVIVNVDLKIPNTFTPNNDGVNDVWNINNLNNFEDVTVDIYNRYGAPVFHSNGYPSAWNGTTKGRKVPAGVYYYIIKVADVNLKKAGSITVLY